MDYSVSKIYCRQGEVRLREIYLECTVRGTDILLRDFPGCGTVVRCTGVAERCRDRMMCRFRWLCPPYRETLCCCPDEILLGDRLAAGCVFRVSILPDPVAGLR